MSRVDCAIQTNKAAYKPGERLEGEFRWDGLSVGQVLVLALVWHTEGRGTEDSSVVFEATITDCTSLGVQAFALVLPVDLPSFSAELIRVIWTVEIRVEGGDDGAKTQIVIAPEATELRL